ALNLARGGQARETGAHYDDIGLELVHLRRAAV
ncbi:MAG: hypothetical protein QOD66_2366, partial [Solirubrobacteraceae bacterium]|nr:hypothetical protein [Solirubrobacteraceae bacterium]